MPFRDLQISSSGSGGNAQTLDGLDSSQFLRSDTSDEFSSGTLTIGSSANLKLAKVESNKLVKADANNNIVSADLAEFVSAGNNVTVIDNGNGTVTISSSGSGDPDALKKDGSVQLITDWDAGDFNIRAKTFESDAPTGTAPLTVASSTVVTNLNADKLDGNDASAFQPVDPKLTDIAGLVPSDGAFIVGDGSHFVTESGATARASLGLGSIATQNANNVSITGGSITGITDLAVADGGTGASDPATARANLGLGTGNSPDFTGLTLSGLTAERLVKTDVNKNIVSANASEFISAGSNITVSDNGDGSVTISATGEGGAPGGSNGQVQFNDNGALAGASGLVYDKVNGYVGIGQSTPTRRLVVREDQPVSVTTMALYNANTTDGNGIAYSYRSDTTGTGGTAFQEFGIVQCAFEAHDHATRKGSIGFYTANGGSPAERMRIKADGKIYYPALTAGRLVQSDADKNMASANLVDFVSAGSGVSVSDNGNGGVIISAEGGGSSVSGYWFNPCDYGAVGDGSTDCTSAFNNCIAAMDAGDIMIVPDCANYYKITGQINVNKAITILSYGAEIRQTTTDKPILVVTASNVVIDGLKLTNTQRDAYAGHTDEKGIYAHGASPDSPITNVVIRNCTINRCVWGIHLVHVHDFLIEKNNVLQSAMYGICAYSPKRGKIIANTVDDVGFPDPTYAWKQGQGFNTYGIVMTNQSGYPTSEDIEIIGNIVRNIPQWEGIDHHGMIRGVIADNIVNRCWAGIVMGGGTNYNAKNVTVRGNVIDGGKVGNTSLTAYAGTGATTLSVNDTSIFDVGDVARIQLNSGEHWGRITSIGTGTITITPGLPGPANSGNYVRNQRGWGISLVGVNESAKRCENYAIVGNTIRNHGKDQETLDAAEIKYSSGCVFANNTIYDCLWTGLYLKDVYGVIVEGNTFTDIYANLAGSAHGITFDGVAEATVANNRFIKDDMSAGYVLTYAMRIYSSATAVTLTLGTNHSEADTFLLNQPGLVNFIQEYVDLRNTRFHSSAPTSGSWNQGDIVWNSNPAPGGYIGWVCTSGGTPGTWKGFGAIAG